ncbi:MAG: glycosyltransferase family 2 protein [Chloroflexi bacterium]|nr:glycosyltransferase family 2 protein [Chloroflexota bacterium]
MSCDRSLSARVRWDKSRYKIIAAIPAYNEAGFIGEVVSKAKRFVNEVVVIDDGSTDNTARTARSAGAIVIAHNANKGYGEAIKSCFKVATMEGADILVILDGDGQHDPNDIPKLLAPLLTKEADMVIGSRFLPPAQLTQGTQQTQRTNIRRYRKFGINTITFLLNLGSKTRVSDAQSGFRAYSRRLLDALSPTEKGMAASVEILIRAREKGFVIAEVPISCVYHSQSSSLNPVIHGLSVALTVIKLRLFRH